MSTVKVQGNASGTGSITLASPNTNSDRTQTLPDGTGTVVVNGVNGALVSGTAVASTSGTSIDFTGIPSWVKRVTVIWNGVSTNSTSTRRIQIGSGSVQTTGYSCAFGYATSAVASVTSTAGFDVINGSAAEVVSGHMILTNISGFVWVASAVFTTSGGTAGLYYSGGNVTLSGALDRVRITTANGTDTFDAGSINILYE